MGTRVILFRVACVWLNVCLATVGVMAQDAATTEQKLRFYEQRIRPLLAEHCYQCHGADEQESDLRLDSIASILKGGKSGAAVVPGRLQSSLLITAVEYQDAELKMPPESRLTPLQVADLTHWVKTLDPEVVGSAPSTRDLDLERGRKHWAFRPPSSPEVPSVQNPRWVSNPIDAFVLHKLEAAGLRPSDRVTRLALIRRATFDLTGLPPTPNEVDAFLSDVRPGAFPRLIDRLLASPAYGERWGRHWLDVARYADSNGLDENVAHGNAWRYRDYVVRAFNQDKPYDEFVVEQLAGDLIEHQTFQQRNQRYIATGFLVLGPKVLAEVDETKMEMDIIDEQLDTLGRSILGLTLGCARCHDHKFDPLGQDDYYALAGILKSTQTMETFKKVAKWHEHSLASEAQLEEDKALAESIQQQQESIKSVVLAAKKELDPPPAKSAKPDDLESRFPQPVKAELSALRKQLKQLEAQRVELPSAMGVRETKVVDVPIHIRGSHLTLGDVMPRRFPRVLSSVDSDAAPDLLIDQQGSGRLELARWITRPDHPLTARVMVNRIWRHHFGRGLAESTDNFGLQTSEPLHVNLLNWLAVRFVESGWSIKEMHRLIMTSSAYQLSGTHPTARERDPENRLFARYDVRRLEAEAIRDSILAASGTLDRTMTGSLLHVGNREYIFNHESKEATNYESQRRSIYLPVIRNHLYPVFQLFDYTDASVASGHRSSSILPTQALFMMNSPFVEQASSAFARQLISEFSDGTQRVQSVYLRAFSRPATDQEVERALSFVHRAQQLSDSAAELQAWKWLCQSMFAANEFIYIQ